MKAKNIIILLVVSIPFFLEINYYLTKSTSEPLLVNLLMYLVAPSLILLTGYLAGKYENKNIGSISAILLITWVILRFLIYGQRLDDIPYWYTQIPITTTIFFVVWLWVISAGSGRGEKTGEIIKQLISNFGRRQ